MPPAPPNNDAKAIDDDVAAAAAVAEIESVLESSQELLLSIEEPNDDLPQPPVNIPKYRHSIDLALPSVQSSIHSTKYAIVCTFEIHFVCAPIWQSLKALIHYNVFFLLFPRRSVISTQTYTDIRSIVHFGKNQMTLN